MSAHVLAHHAPGLVGSRVCRRVIVPPVRRAPSAVVDPRIGDLGPALLALEDGTVFPGVAFGAAVASGGDLVVNTSQTGYQEVCTDPSYAGQVVVMTYPLIGNYGRLVVRRPVASGHGSGPSSSPTPRPRSSMMPASSPPSCATPRSRPSPAWTLARSPGTCVPTAACAAIVTAPGRRRRRACRGGCPGRHALGGPGLRQPGLAAGRHRVRRGGRSTGHASGSWTWASRRTSSGRCAIAARRSGSSRTPRSSDGRPRGRHRRRDPVAWSRAIRPASSRPGRPRPGDHRRRAPPARDLPRSPDRRAGGRRGDEPTPFGHHGANHPVQDLELGLVQVTAQNHEVQVVGDTLPPTERLPGQPGEPQRRVGRGPAPSRAADRDRPVPPGGRARTARRARGVRSLRGRPRARPAIGGALVSTARAEARLGPDPRVGPGRHRPGRGVRLRRDAGVSGPAGRGRPDDPRQQQPRHDHDRPVRRGRHLPRAAHRRGGRGGHRPRETRRAACRPRWPDRAEPGHGAVRGRRLRAPRHQAAGHAAGGDPDGRGPRGVPRPPRPDRPAVCAQRDRRGRERRRSARRLGERALWPRSACRRSSGRPSRSVEPAAASSRPNPPTASASGPACAPARSSR